MEIRHFIPDKYRPPIAVIAYTGSKESYTRAAHEQMREYKKFMKKKGRIFGYVGYVALVFFVLQLLNKYSSLDMPGINSGPMKTVISISILIVVIAAVWKFFRWLFTWIYYLDIKRLVARMDFSKPFQYAIHEEGIVVNEPHQHGAFHWNDFAEVNIYGDLVYMIFCPPGVKGKEWTRHFTSILIPAEVMKSHPQALDYLRQLRAGA